MKKSFFTMGSAFVFLISLYLLTAATNDQGTELEKFVPNEVLVKFNPEAGRSIAQAAIESLQVKVVTYLNKEVTLAEWDPDIRTQRSFLADPYLLHIRVPEHIGTERAIAFLKTNPNIEYAEKNYVVTFLETVPNDTQFSRLWGLRNTGQTGGTPDADIDASDAWDIFTGNPNVVVAVIDTGIDYNHIDLQANIWINPNEIPGNGIDDDGNGYIDDYRGWNFVSGNNDPMDYHPSSHGTHVAGTIGAAGNNGTGVTGVCWNVKLMALKIADTASAVSAIDYATYNGAHLSNNSWSVPASSALRDAITRAAVNGKLFVAAAGNDNRNNDNNPVYPASYTHSNIVSVLATNHNDNKSSFSNYGRTSVDLGAPGGSDTTQNTHNIYSTRNGDLYRYLSGTSMAAPHVAGVAALAIGKCPPITYTQLKSRLLAKVDVLASLNNKCVSNGRVNTYKVIYDPTAPNAPGNPAAAPTGWTTIRLTWNDNSTNEIGFELQRKAPGMPDHAYLKSADANQTSIEDWTAVAGQAFFYRLRAYNMAGVSGFSNEVNATIPIGSPEAPSGLSGVWDWGQSAVHLTWGDMSNNEEHFIIERKSEWETQWTQVAQLGQNYASHYDSGVAGDTFYSYRVKVTNPIGYAYSDIVQVYVPQH